MKIGGTIKIGNLTYQLGYLSDGEAERSYGRSNRAKQNIRFDPGSSVEQREETFFHELVHQIFCEYGYYDESESEKLVKCVSVGLYQALRDNGCLVQPLFTEERNDATA